MKRAALAVFALLAVAGVAHAQSLFDISSYVSGNSSPAASPPSPVDLLFESNSYTPPFYQGRALPSPGALVHVVAIAHLNDGGAPVPESNILYTWRVDNRVQGSLSGAGKSSIVLPAPTLFGSNVISVDAQEIGGSAHGSASLTVSSVDPQLALYLDDPLSGIGYYDALGAQNTISGTEATFAAVPYFVAASTLAYSQFSWDWLVNDQSVGAGSGNELTINAQNSAGTASLSLSLTSRANPLLDAQGSWNLSFETGY
jgi:hypothetical protein